MKNCIIRINQGLDSFSKSERVIAHYILDNVGKASGMTITELSAACKTSGATIVRFTHNLGYSGYRDFIKSLYMDANNKEHYPENILDLENIPSENSSLSTTIMRVSNGNLNAISDSVKIIDVEAIGKAIEIINLAGKIYFYAIGGSSIAAKDAVFKFQRIGIECQAFDNVHDQILSASILKKGDVAVYISYSGETKDLLKSYKIAKENGAFTIGITKYGENTIAKNVDLNIHHASVAEGIRTNSTKSRIAQLNIVDILFTAVAEKRLDRLQRFYSLTNDVFLSDKNIKKGDNEN